MRSTLAILTLLLLTGCSHSRGGAIRLAPDNGPSIPQNFSQGFFNVSKDGDFDILLVDNASAWEYHKSPRKGALQSVEITPVHQVFVVHSNWSHKPGTQHSAASANATLTWYVLGDSTARDMVVYQGIAHVRIGGDVEDTRVSVSIVDGNLSPSLIAGNMQDPLGPSRVTGDFYATRSESQVKEILGELQERAKKGK